MVITKTTPFTKSEIEQLLKEWQVYVKLVVDLKSRSISAGAEFHTQLVDDLKSLGSSPLDLWGGGYDLETGTVDTNADLNYRPELANTDTSILDPLLKDQFEALVKYFFSHHTPSRHV